MASLITKSQSMQTVQNYWRVTARLMGPELSSTDVSAILVLKYHDFWLEVSILKERVKEKLFVHSPFWLSANRSLLFRIKLS